MESPGSEIDVHALADLRVRAAAHTVLDVREPNEVAICALERSIFIPLRNKSRNSLRRCPMIIRSLFCVITERAAPW